MTIFIIVSFMYSANKKDDIEVDRFLKSGYSEIKQAQFKSWLLYTNDNNLQESKLTGEFEKVVY